MRAGGIDQRGTARALPPPTAGEGGPRVSRGRERGTQFPNTGEAVVRAGAFLCTVTPLSRPGLTAGPPSPAEASGLTLQKALSQVPETQRVSPPPCGEGSGVGVVPDGAQRCLLSHPHLQLLPARGRRAHRAFRKPLYEYRSPQRGRERRMRPQRLSGRRPRPKNPTKKGASRRPSHDIRLAHACG